MAVLQLDPSLTLLDNLDEEGYVSYVKRKRKSDKFTSTIRLTDKVRHPERFICT
jgi:hypothetical protein